MLLHCVRSIRNFEAASPPRRNSGVIHPPIVEAAASRVHVSEATQRGIPHNNRGEQADEGPFREVASYIVALGPTDPVEQAVGWTEPDIR
jgi:hypothetical protein